MEIRKNIINIFFKKDSTKEKPLIDWEYGEGINSYFLIGILEDIKLELLNDIDEQSNEN